MSGVKLTRRTLLGGLAGLVTAGIARIMGPSSPFPSIPSGTFERVRARAIEPGMPFVEFAYSNGDGSFGEYKRLGGAFSWTEQPYSWTDQLPRESFTAQMARIEADWPFVYASDDPAFRAMLDRDDEVTE